MFGHDHVSDLLDSASTTQRFHTSQHLVWFTIYCWVAIVNGIIPKNPTVHLGGIA